jgi:hypothetical protein
VRIDPIGEFEKGITATTQDGLELRCTIARDAKWDKRKLRVVSAFCEIRTILTATRCFPFSSDKSGLLI